MVIKKNYTLFVEIYGISENNEHIQLFNANIPLSDDLEFAKSVVKEAFYTCYPSKRGAEFADIQIIHVERVSNERAPVLLAQFTIRSNNMNQFTWYKSVLVQ